MSSEDELKRRYISSQKSRVRSLDYDNPSPRSAKYTSRTHEKTPGAEEFAGLATRPRLNLSWQAITPDFRAISESIAAVPGHVWRSIFRICVALIFLIGGVSAVLAINPNTNPIFDSQKRETFFAEALISNLQSGQPSPEMHSAIMRLSRKFPLSVVPYELEILVHQAESRIDYDVIERLADAALVRNPRSKVARLANLGMYAQRGDWTAFLDEYSLLYKLWPEEREGLNTLLRERIISDSVSQAVTIERISHTRPDWGRALVESMPVSKDNVVLIRKIIAGYPDLHATYVEHVARDIGLEDAYRTWLSIYGAEGIQGFPINPSFERNDFPRPFNWLYTKSNAEPDREGGLHVSYSGRNRVLLARQIMPLTPGSYRFEVFTKGVLKEKSGKIFWLIKCVSDNGILGSVEYTDMASVYTALSFEFDIPKSDCPFQEVGLVGRPGEYFYPSKLRVKNVRISERL